MMQLKTWGSHTVVVFCVLAPCNDVVWYQLFSLTPIHGIWNTRNKILNGIMWNSMHWMHIHLWFLWRVFNKMRYGL
jgi:hypothetical protein